ncbi:MAG: TolB family protein, partial [Candidatus Aminicenantaceae bacterium]
MMAKKKSCGVDHLVLKHIVTAVFLCTLALTLVFSAQTKPPATFADYGQWEALAWAGSYGGISPDGNWLAYQGCTDRGDECGLWVMQPGGFSSARLSRDVSDASPSWSPDGKEIIFVSNRGRIWGSGGFWRMRASDGAEPREIRYE